MARIMILLPAVLFALGIAVPNAFAEEETAMGMGKPSALGSMVGTGVLDSKGEYLGRVSDFVIDSRGQVTFVVISHGGFLRIREKDTAVPFGSFGYDRQKRNFVLDLTSGQLNMAPAFTKRDLYSETWAEGVYRYFGQTPYWTEGELVEKGMKPQEGSITDFGGFFNPQGYTP